MTLTLQTAIARYGAEAKAKLHNVAASGEPEEQLRAPLEGLIDDLAELCGFPRDAVQAVGESAIAALKTRPDYAVTLRNALVGFIEIKAPGKGADPRRFRGHDKEQWEKLQSLPNLLYTDGNQFSLFRSGQLEGAVVSSQGGYRNVGRDPPGPARVACLIRQLFPLGADPADHREGTGKGRRPPLSIAPRRGGRTTGPAKSRAHGAWPSTGGSCSSPRPTTPNSPTATRRPLRSVCSWPAREIQLATGLDQAAKKLGPDELADRRRAPPPDRRRGQSKDVEDVAGHAHASPRRRQLAHDQQGQPGCVALLL